MLPARRPDQNVGKSPDAGARGAGFPSSSIVRARLVIITGGGGIFIYSATGTLVGSWVGKATTDPVNKQPVAAGLTAINATISGVLSASVMTGSSILNSTWAGGTITDPKLVFDQSGGETLLYSATLTTVTNPASPWTAPAGVTSVTAQVWGAGGNSGQGGCAGGGGGEFAQQVIGVTPANTYVTTLAAGGSGVSLGVGLPGGDQSFAGDSQTVTAHGGGGGSATGGGLGGTGSAAPIHFNGGSGGGATGTGGGGGGGSSAGTSSAGNNGAAAVGNNGGAGGAAPSGGGKGGNGGNLGTIGHAGSSPGGGGASGGSNSGDNNPGANGQIVLSYVTGTALVGSVAGLAGTDSLGNSFPAGFMGQMVAVQPGSSPQVPETWHSLGTLANITVNVGLYRFTPGGELELDISLTSLAGALTQTTFSVTLPAAYRPAHNKFLPAATDRAQTAANAWPRVEVDTLGDVIVFIPAAVAGINFWASGLIPLN